MEADNDDPFVALFPEEPEIKVVAVIYSGCMVVYGGSLV